MFKALIGKQFLEMNSWLFQNKKTGGRRSKAGIVGYAILYLILCASLGAMFFGSASTLCGPLVTMGLNWLYFSLMSLTAVMLGIFFSVFTVSSTLYKAKDNDFLLSLPVKPSAILAARLLGIWLWSLIYEAVVLVPTFIVYFMTASRSISVIIYGIFLLFSISLLALTISCALGWLVAKISEKMKNKSMITVIASLLFFALYYYITFKAGEMLKTVILYASAIGEKVKTSIYPLYVIGMAGSGSTLFSVITVIFSVLIFALMFIILSKSFIKIATSNTGAKKKLYKGGKSSARSTESALLFKEFKRFVSSPVYMLNCGLGVILIPVGAISALFKGDDLSLMLGEYIDVPKFLPLIVCAVMCLLSTMNDITAPSVSLEGKNIWLVHSLPVKPQKVLMAKLKLHLLFTEIPVFICTVFICIVFGFEPFTTAVVTLTALLFVLLSASFGLIISLKTPNLTWTNETIPVKQNFGVALALFGGFLFVMVIAALYFALRFFLSPIAYLAVCAAFIAILDFCALKWLNGKGAEIFSRL